MNGRRLSKSRIIDDSLSGKTIKVINSSKTKLQNLFQNFAKEMDNLGGKVFLVNEKDVPYKLKMMLSDTVKELLVYQTPLSERFILETSLNENKNLLTVFLDNNSTHKDKMRYKLWLKIRSDIRLQDFNHNLYLILS